jgi:exodeoxyribonuclease V alpha subunit
MADMSKNRLHQLIAEARAKAAAKLNDSAPEKKALVVELEQSIAAATDNLPRNVEQILSEGSVKELVDNNTNLQRVDMNGDASLFSWNKEQTEAIALARKLKSFILIGAAGTGKTTTEKQIVEILINEHLVPEELGESTKFLRAELPGIVLTSFTRRAVRNSRRAVDSTGIGAHCITLHKLLEYEPVYYEVWDEQEGKNRTTMRFEPMRHRLQKLPTSLKVIIIDESSMVSTELFQKLIEALPDPAAVMFIFVGDLHQLPPVYGTAILGFKLLDLPVVELTQIYRQAQGSPIIALAHQIKNGEDIPVTEKRVMKSEMGTVTLHPWKKALSDFDACHTTGLFLSKLVREGHFNEEEDVILSPQGQVKKLAFGTDELNRVVAQALGEKRKAEVYEVIAGFAKLYLAVGDRVLVGREDAVILEINKNGKYWGKRARPSSMELDRWGNYRKKIQETQSNEDYDLDKELESLELTGSESAEDRKQEASHVIRIQLLDSELEESLSSAGELNAMQFSYCLTVHKSQGSEWERVFFLTHKSHAQQWSRELLYTAVTRARRELYMIIEPDRAGQRGTLWKAAKAPRIKGDTLAEKAEYFKGKREEYESEEVVDLDSKPTLRRKG